MKKQILLVCLLLIPCPVAFAQKKTESGKQKCTLGIDQSPELRGFRMGMTQAAVQAKLPGVTIEKPDKFGLSRLRLSIVDPTSLIKTPAARAKGDKGVQPDIVAGGTEGSAFVLESSRFPTLKGARRIQMRFIDSRLSYLEVLYNDDVKFDSIDQFTERLSAMLKLPSEWQTPEEADSDHVKELRCEGFVLAANTLGSPIDTQAGPELVLQDVAAWKAMSKRQNELTEKAKREEEEKRKTFKP
jgi:hypothetical protein